MSAIQLGQRGRLVAAALAGVLAVAAVVLAIVATAGQQDAASPSPSAAVPGWEGTRDPSTSPGSAPSTTPLPSPSASPAGRRAVVGPILSPSKPVSLDVPRIGIKDARLVHLGLAKDGSIQVPGLGPNSPAGWFQNSPTPGQLGPSVIVGHVDSETAGPAIFYELGTLRPGDTVTVIRADRTVAVFRVESVVKYAKATFPTLKVFGDTDHAALRLITCGGRFNPAEQSYEDNIVVYARLVSSHQA